MQAVLTLSCTGQVLLTDEGHAPPGPWRSEDWACGERERERERERGREMESESESERGREIEREAAATAQRVVSARG